VIFDRSWYNRAGVERVMGFCTQQEYEQLPRSVPAVREAGGHKRHPADQVLAGGGHEEQNAALRGADRGPAAAVEAQPDGPGLAREVVRVLARPRRDAEGHGHAHAPWYILRSDEKRRARLNCLAHFLSLIPYEKVRREKIELPPREQKGAYDDTASLEGCRLCRTAMGRGDVDGAVRPPWGRSVLRGWRGGAATPERELVDPEAADARLQRAGGTPSASAAPPSP
jgi:hypothetical protein